MVLFPDAGNPVSQMAVGESAEQFMNAIMGESPDVMLGHGSAMLLNLTPGERLDFVGIRARANEPAGSLSYGDQRRLEIARALATELAAPASGVPLAASVTLPVMVR